MDWIYDSYSGKSTTTILPGELKEKTTEAAQTTTAPVNFEMSIKELTERDATITIVTSDLVVDMNLYFYVPTSDEPNVFNINVIKRTNVVRLSPLPQGLILISFIFFLVFII